uniref:Serpin peptidase inhibitor, clade I (neuroserpin), member 1 n=1 Tax=Hucho hucho TaxID=62062 RepID=A0A4W5JL62_9TELE
AANVCLSVRLPDEEFSLLQNLTGALSEDDAHYIIRLANSIFLQSGVTFNPEFLRLMRKYFRAEVETVDFSESAAVAEQINGWVENHTESKIRDLLSADDFSSVTRLTLVNAVYFRGSWKNQFRPENTRTFSFSKDDGSEAQTHMMYQQGDFYYGACVCYCVVFPLQYCVVFPLQYCVVFPLEYCVVFPLQYCVVFPLQYCVDFPLQYCDIFPLQYCDIFPLFFQCVECSLSFSPFLCPVGMIALTRTLVLYPQVMADHPFFFIIRNRRTGSILFMGRVMTPEVIEPTDFDNDSM